MPYYLEEDMSLEKIRAAGSSLLLMILIWIDVNAQQAATVRLIPEARLYYGFSHVDEMYQPAFSDGNFPMFEFSLSRETFGLNRWEILYNYPKKGVAFVYTTLTGNDPVSSIGAAVPFVNFPVSIEKKWVTSLRVGAGAAYLGRRAPIEVIDPLTTLRITHLNAAFLISPQFAYSPTSKWTITAGLAGWHFTNLAIKSPEFFINVGNVFIGTSYIFGDGVVTPQAQPLAGARKRWVTTIAPAVGYKLRGKPEKAYFPLSLSLNESAYINKKKRIGLTFDAFYDSHIKEKLETGTDTTYSTSINFRTGVAPSFIWVIGSLQIPFDFGVYLFPKYVSDGSFYQRLGFRYYFGKNIFLNGTVKTHFFEPDHVEMGVGASF